MKKLILFIIVCLVAYALLTNAIDNAPDIDSYSFTGYTEDYDHTTETSSHFEYPTFDFTESATTERFYTAANTTTRRSTTTTTRRSTTTTTRADSSTSTTQKSNSELPRAARYIPDQSVCYHYRQLNTYGKEIYNLLLSNAATGDITFTFNLKYDGEYYEDSLKPAIYGFVQDHPEFFWLTRGYSYNYRGNTIKITLATRDFWNLSVSHRKYTEAFYDKVDYILSLANKYNTDFEKALFVHDYIAGITTYDHDAAEDNSDGRWSIQSDYAFSSYGGLVNGKFVCGGYSAAYQLIMQQLGIECAWVSGYTSDGGYHAWNLVNLDGKYYWTDLTWDDVDDWTTSGGKVTYIDGARYNYFNLTTSDFSKEHSTENFDYPACTATQNNYYHHEGYFISNYSKDKIEDAFARQVAAGKTDITLKFANTADYEKAYSYLFYGAGSRILNKHGYYGDFTWYSYDKMLSIDCCLLDK